MNPKTTEHRNRLFNPDDPDDAIAAFAGDSDHDLDTPDEAIDHFALDSDSHSLNTKSAEATSAPADVSPAESTSPEGIEESSTPPALDATFEKEGGRAYLRVEIDPQTLASARRFAEEAGEDLAASLATLVRHDLTDREAKRRKLETEIEAHRRALYKKAAKTFLRPAKRGSTRRKKVVEKEQEQISQS